ncbi:ice-binding family protein [Jatrophihabitans telluris]|uniref:Ice-binding family protein n=1 Tax=Jatrophihabitans telluris TaxID=2038343 RepID=A0ABY4R072_9ACTN|nr:ice-binding family protein [Jatrophihabitans telluris]UQX88993.1 ice-binding family protein [Jatrophihabitans telluris]
MFSSYSHPSRTGRRLGRFLVALAGAPVLAVMVGTAAPAGASPATPSIDLGTAASYSVLAGQTVTNTGPSTLSGDLGVSPGTAITGFPPGIAGGARHSADAVAGLAQSDVSNAYRDAAGRASTQAVAGDLVGRTLNDGVYTSSGPLALSGTVTFDGRGDPSSVFIVQVASTLITATASHVVAINGAQACHIYWQVGRSATLGTASTFQGTLLAATSVTVTTSTHVKGRALAGTGSVTLDNDVFTAPDCSDTPPAGAASTTTSVTVPSSAKAGTPVSIGAHVISTGGPVVGTVSFYDNGVAIGSAPVDTTGHATIIVPAGTTLPGGTVVAVYGGSPNSAPSTSAPRAFVVTAAATTPRRTAAPFTTSAHATATRSVHPATSHPMPVLPKTGPSSVALLTAIGGAALLLGLLLLLAARTRSTTDRRH